MPTVRKSAIVPHPCSAMFALVDDVERYPDFLPCVELASDYTFSSRVLEVALGAVFGHITETLVNHFVARSEVRG